jgi:hypothetical protein
MTCRIGRWLSLTLVCAVGIAAGAAETPASWTDDLAPITPRDWTYERAAHLIERAGFGATPDEIERLARLTPQLAVDRLVDYETVDNSGVKPFEESGIWDPGMDPFPPSRADAVRAARERGAALGVPVLPAGSPRRLQPVVDKFSTASEPMRSKRSGSVCGGRTACSSPRGRSKRSSRCSGTATSPPAT